MFAIIFSVDVAEPAVQVFDVLSARHICAIVGIAFQISLRLYQRVLLGMLFQSLG